MLTGIVFGGAVASRSRNLNSSRSRVHSGALTLLVGKSAQMCAAALSEYGFETIDCAEDRCPVEMLGNQAFELILCDLDLPHGGGDELVGELCAKSPDSVVVVVTKARDLRRGIMAMMAGASGYIQFPAEPNEMIETLQSLRLRKRLESAVLRSSSHKANAPLDDLAA